MTTKTVALATLAATQLMVILDGTVVTVALPAIRDDLGFGDTSLSWVVNGFLLAFAIVLLPAGRAGDVFGTRPVFLAGLSIFTLASAWCGLAWDPISLVVARFVQGVGGGVASAVVLGMIAGLYAEPVSVSARSRCSPSSARSAPRWAPSWAVCSPTSRPGAGPS